MIFPKILDKSCAFFLYLNSPVDNNKLSSSRGVNLPPDWTETKASSLFSLTHSFGLNKYLKFKFSKFISEYKTDVVQQLSDISSVNVTYILLLKIRISLKEKDLSSSFPENKLTLSNR